MAIWSRDLQREKAIDVSGFLFVLEGTKEGRGRSLRSITRPPGKGVISRRSSSTGDDPVK